MIDGGGSCKRFGLAARAPLQKYVADFSFSEAWGPPQFQEKRSRGEKAILGALGGFRGILRAALGVQKVILGMRNSTLGMAFHDLSNTKPVILGATPGAIPGIDGTRRERFSFAPYILGAFFQEELGWSPCTGVLVSGGLTLVKPDTPKDPSFSLHVCLGNFSSKVVRPEKWGHSQVGGHLKPVTLKPVIRIFRIFRVFCVFVLRSLLRPLFSWRGRDVRIFRIFAASCLNR